MRMVRCRQVVALCAAAVMLLVACGDDEDSSSPTTAPATSTTVSQVELDRQKAQRVVLTAADVPGYTQDPERSQNSAEVEAAVNACVNNNPLLVRLGEDSDSRGAKSPQFSRGDALSVTASATFGETEDEARGAITAFEAPSFNGCFSNAVAAELRRDPAYSNVSVTTARLPALNAGDQSIGYRTTARLRTAGQAVTFYLDYTFVRSGRGVAVLSGNGVNTPVPEADRSRLATTMAGRLAAP